jgi:hypothetical protein
VGVVRESDESEPYLAPVIAPTGSKVRLLSYESRGVRGLTDGLNRDTKSIPVGT